MARYAADLMVDAALTYARAGLRVHPCRQEDKRPLTRWGTAATTDEAKVRAFWRRWPDALIAVCTGSGLVVVDDDRGLAEPDEWFRDTLTCRTRSRGFHHWYYDTHQLGCAVGVLPGIDIRGEGGYVISPPSPGWQWVNDEPIQVLPRIFREHGELRKRAGRRYGSGFEPAEAGSIGEGYRHDYMVRFAGWAIRAFKLDDDEHALVELCIGEYQRACSPADAPNENIARIARSILGKHRRA